MINSIKNLDSAVFFDYEKLKKSIEKIYVAKTMTNGFGFSMTQFFLADIFKQELENRKYLTKEEKYIALNNLYRVNKEIYQEQLDSTFFEWNDYLFKNLPEVLSEKNKQIEDFIQNQIPINKKIDNNLYQIYFLGKSVYYNSYNNFLVLQKNKNKTRKFFISAQNRENYIQSLNSQINAVSQQIETLKNIRYFINYSLPKFQDKEQQNKSQDFFNDNIVLFQKLFGKNSGTLSYLANDYMANVHHYFNFLFEPVGQLSDFKDLNNFKLKFGELNTKIFLNDAIDYLTETKIKIKLFKTQIKRNTVKKNVLCLRNDHSPFNYFQPFFDLFLNIGESDLSCFKHSNEDFEFNLSFGELQFKSERPLFYKSEPSDQFKQIDLLNPVDTYWRSECISDNCFSEEFIYLDLIFSENDLINSKIKKEDEKTFFDLYLNDCITCLNNNVRLNQGIELFLEQKNKKEFNYSNILNTIGFSCFTFNNFLKTQNKKQLLNKFKYEYITEIIPSVKFKTPEFFNFNLNLFSIVEINKLFVSQDEMNWEKFKKIYIDDFSIEISQFKNSISNINKSNFKLEIKNDLLNQCFYLKNKFKFFFCIVYQLQNNMMERRNNYVLNKEEKITLEKNIQNLETKYNISDCVDFANNIYQQDKEFALNLYRFQNVEKYDEIYFFVKKRFLRSLYSPVIHIFFHSDFEKYVSLFEAIFLALYKEDLEVAEKLSLKLENEITEVSNETKDFFNSFSDS